MWSDLLSCVLVYAFMYLPHFIFLSNHTYSFCKANGEQVGYVECQLSFKMGPFLIFWKKKPSIIFIKVLNTCWNFQKKVTVYHFCCLIRWTVWISCVIPTLQFPKWAPPCPGGHLCCLGLHCACPGLCPVVCYVTPTSSRSCSFNQNWTLDSRAVTGQQSWRHGPDL